jgi:hypothetical protein
MRIANITAESRRNGAGKVLVHQNPASVQAEPVTP